MKAKTKGDTLYVDIGPKETQRGEIVGRQPARPSLVMGLLLATMAMCVCHILGELDMLSPAYLILLIGSWTTIAASETDVNSPLNQTLMDKIRGNQDHVERASIKGGCWPFYVSIAFVADRVYAIRFVPLQDCRIDKLLLCAGNVGEVAGFDIIGGIYDDNSNPDNLLVESPAAVTIAAGWDYAQFVIELGTVIALTGGTPYWYAFLADASGGLMGGFAGASQSSKYVAAPSDGQLPAVFGTPGGSAFMFGGFVA